MTTDRVLVGDAIERLRDLPDASVDACITSPPYFLLRNYQVGGQWGLEGHVDEWVAHLRAVCGEVARVLKPTASLVLNVGDSYSRSDRFGAPAKSLLCGPERLLLGLVADGWIVRNKIVWHKTNSMPSSVRDRLTCTWEPLYLLVRSRTYHLDLDAVRVPHRSRGRASPAAARRAAAGRSRPPWAGPLAGSQHGLNRLKAHGLVGHPLGKNPGDVITSASSNYRGAHFATFPEALIAPLVRATVPERVCVGCGQPWSRPPARQLGHLATLGTLVPACRCRAAHQPGLVLDPFMGAGTVAVVAERLQRRWIGIELNPDFAELTAHRLAEARRQARTGPKTKAA
jgi:DNA modification methylase